MERVAADGYEFVFIKATEGVDFKDRNFRVNYDKAEKAGLKTGIYHFFRFDRDGVEQALNLLKAVGKRRPDLGIVIDVEKAGNPDSIPKEKIQSRLTHMVEYLNLLGHRVMFYSNRDGYYEYLADAFPGAPLWICGFSENPIHAEWSFWQFNHRGKWTASKETLTSTPSAGQERNGKIFLKATYGPIPIRTNRAFRRALERNTHVACCNIA